MPNLLLTVINNEVPIDMPRVEKQLKRELHTYVNKS